MALFKVTEVDPTAAVNVPIPQPLKDVASGAATTKGVGSISV